MHAAAAAHTAAASTTAAAATAAARAAAAREEGAGREESAGRGGHVREEEEVGAGGLGSDGNPSDSQLLNFFMNLQVRMRRFNSKNNVLCSIVSKTTQKSGSPVRRSDKKTRNRHQQPKRLAASQLLHELTGANARITVPYMCTYCVGVVCGEVCVRVRVYLIGLTRGIY